MKLFRSGLKLSLLLLLISSGISAQSHLKGNIASLPPAGTSVILEFFYEDSWKNLQSIVVDKEGNFETTVQFPQTGQYRVRLSIDPRKWADFLVVQKKEGNQVFFLKLDYKTMNGNAAAADPSEESKAYVELMNAYNAMTAKRDSLGKFSQSYLEAERDFTAFTRELSSKYPGTLSGSLLARLLACPDFSSWQRDPFVLDSLLEEHASRALDFVPFQDEHILMHSGYVRRLNYFFDYFYEKNRVAAYVDEVMSKALLNEYVSTFSFRFLLDKMIDYRSEEGLSYLINAYAQDCTESNLMQETTKNLLKALDKCKPGNTIEMLTLPDLSGKRISMQEVIAKNEITIIMFWRSNCSHCKEFEPVLKQMADKYEGKGLGVYAINTDKMEADWRERQSEMDVPWPSVFLAYDQRKDFNKRFPVPATPTLIAVDKKGVIIRRLIMRAKFEEVLNEMFSEIGKK